jgi:hypothetical protein
MQIRTGLKSKGKEAENMRCQSKSRALSLDGGLWLVCQWFKFPANLERITGGHNFKDFYLPVNPAIAGLNLDQPRRASKIPSAGVVH